MCLNTVPMTKLSKKEIRTLAVDPFGSHAGGSAIDELTATRIAVAELADARRHGLKNVLIPAHLLALILDRAERPHD